MAGIPLRILIVCDYFSTHSSGGSERVARELAERLSRRADVEIEVFSAIPRNWPPDPLPSGYPLHARPAFDLTALLGAQVAVPAGARRAMRAVLEKFRPDVMHAQSLHFASSFAAATLVRPTGTPLVTTAHLGDVAGLPVQLRLPTQAYENTVGRYVLRRSSAAIAVSASVRDHLHRLGVAEERLHVVANGVDIEAFRAPATGRTVDDRTLRIAFTGRLIANKGPELLLDAATALISEGKDVAVDFYGDGPMRHRIDARIRREGLVQVRTHGHVRDLPPILASTDVLVRPSLTEGLPLGVLEGMAAGCAVVASAVPGNTDLVDDGVSGLLVPPGDLVALTAALRRIADNRALIDQFGRVAQERAERYSWDECASSTLEVLRSAATVA